MQIIGILIDVVGPVFLCALVGYIWARRGTPFDTAFIARLVTAIGTPCLVVDSLTTSGLTTAALAQIALGAAMCLTLALTCGYLLVKALRLQVSLYLPSLTFSNTGNMGLPVTLFAFGPPGLALAIAFFTIASLVNFTVGQAIAAKGLRLRDLLTMPLIWAVVLSIGMQLTGLALPNMVTRAVHILAGITVPLMILSLGYSLARLKISSFNRAFVLSLARLIGGFAIGWAVSLVLGLDGMARGVVVAQSCMPSAVYNYMFAERYGSNAEEVAGLVVLSTLLSLLFLPLFLSTVM